MTFYSEDSYSQMKSIEKMGKIALKYEEHARSWDDVSELNEADMAANNNGSNSIIEEQC